MKKREHDSMQTSTPGCVEHEGDLLYNYPAMMILIRKEGHPLTDKEFHQWVYSDGLADISGFVKPKWIQDQKLNAYVNGSIITLNEEEHSGKITLVDLLYSSDNISDIVDRIDLLKILFYDEQEEIFTRIIKDA